ncbi:HET-domain-containing protein [Lentithecium fluviatile CBS 122367]|uniref:HET-domain-containing protein n=1 Tax=Lentithecium fluviatile CBS 122367 TaxID=1168545 RepID=A0A6G1IFN8_9PLEO|nr:HET-domain-containing protein [Lentithecium fluviatile CBS 122367]
MAHPRSLVCDRCWTRLFDTSAYEDVCHLRRRNGGGLCSVEFEITLRHAVEEKECSLCRFIWALGGRGSGNIADLLDERITVTLAPLIGIRTSPIIYNITFDLRQTEFDPAVQELIMYTQSEDPAAQYVKLRPVQRDVSVEATLYQLRSWMRDCEAHQDCSPKSDVELPTRVIEVSPPGHPDLPRLTRPGSRKGSYATLSYCWGPRPSGLLTTLNVEQYMQQLPLEHLPQSAQDAISIAKAIPVDYLWIDSLCILQDSENDKAREIANMANIYSRSFVTIAAASSEDMADGFLQKRPDRLGYYEHPGCSLPLPGSIAVPFRIASGDFGTVRLQCFKCHMFHDDANEPINKRAWTLQEQALAQRLLVYSSQTLRWCCRTGSSNLGSSLHYRPFETSAATLARVPTDRTKALSQWVKLLNAYDARKMSNNSDRLPALAALAEQYADVLGPGYFAGLWQHDLLFQLCWRRREIIHWGFIDAKGSQDYVISHFEQYRAPSWSWVSTYNLVVVAPTLYFGTGAAPECEIIQVETILKHSNIPYGEVIGGHLIIRGKLRDAFLVGRQVGATQDDRFVWASDLIASTAAADEHYLKDKPLRWKCYVQCILDNPYDWHPYDWGRNLARAEQHHGLGHWQTQPVKCFLLEENCGLLLEEVHSSDTDAKRYRRLGVCATKALGGSSVRLCHDFVDVPLVDITIV